jgi:ATP-dependent Lon protease
VDISDPLAAGIGDMVDIEEQDIPKVIPVMAVRDIVVFNYMIIPLFVGRNASVEAVQEALSEDKLLMLVTQKDSSVDEPGPDDIFKIGMVCMIMRTLKLPDGRLKVLVQAVQKAEIQEYVETEPFLKAAIELIETPEEQEITVEVEALMRNVCDQTEKILSIKGVLSSELQAILNGIEEPGRLADLVVSNLRLKTAESQSVLETHDSVKRLHKVLEYLNKELEVSTMQAKIQSEAKEEMGRTQREYYLREQIMALKKELGEFDEKSEEIEELRDRFKRARMPSTVKKEGEKQLGRLEMMHPDGSEANTIRTYLDWLLDVPWRKTTKDHLDLKIAKEILDEDHYGLDEVKERILEYLAVRKLNKNSKGTILCFVGPPGVGKTSLGRSIARAMGRKFFRFSLGGMRDEAEIRGHRRTYVGAMPGRVIQGLKTVQSANPVFMLDEIDKVGADYRGDPSSALLEVLDPEQNSEFSDHYLNLPYDLSRVMFVTTANMADTIPGPLMDRMELITLSGYTLEEKLEIAKRYLLPRQFKENGIEEKYLKIDDETIGLIISHYTREAGLRNLEREIGKVFRKVARRIAEGGKGPYVISKRTLSKYLGPFKVIPEADEEGIRLPGMATGLAWTEVGGEILTIEISLLAGKGGLTLTGQLGDVMKESAQAALTVCREKLPKLKLKADYFETKDLHIHVPAGAIPKDGPSAGITMAVALYSAMTGKTMKRGLAMTGEITLRGRVLPIGGLKEKALAALRANITTIIIPEQNKMDLVEIPEDLRAKLTFIPVKNIDQVFRKAFD